MLGTFEAGLFPGVNYYLSWCVFREFVIGLSLTSLYSWYKRSEFGIRAAVFFSAATVSGAFGGLLAVGTALLLLAQISSPLPGRYLEYGGYRRQTCMGLDFASSVFLISLTQAYNKHSILEGLVTVLAGAASFWIIQDFPDTAKFLSEAERTVVIRRLQVDDQFSAAGEKLKMKYIWKSLLDWKTWIGSMTLQISIRHETYFVFSDCIHGGRHAAVCVFSFPAIHHQ